MGNIETVGTIQVIYTIEPDKDDPTKAIATYWMQNGVKIGSMSVQREQKQ